LGQLLDPQSIADEKARIEERIRLLEQQKSMEEGLPHLYGWPWYQWAWDFFSSTNRFNLLCAANQISKSSTQIRKCIHWATAVDLWPKLWKSRPTQFWYFYPTFDVATSEFHEKWKKEFLPRGEWKDHPVYGWKEEIRNKQIYAIYFNSGVTVYFKSYEQKAENLQTASVYAMFCDEEVPEDLYPEIVSRISAATIRGTSTWSSRRPSVRSSGALPSRRRTNGMRPSRRRSSCRCPSICAKSTWEALLVPGPTS
jgi:hypothetical protein